MIRSKDTFAVIVKDVAKGRKVKKARSLNIQFMNYKIM